MTDLTGRPTIDQWLLGYEDGYNSEVIKSDDPMYLAGYHRGQESRDGGGYHD